MASKNKRRHMGRGIEGMSQRQSSEKAGTGVKPVGEGTTKVRDSGLKREKT